MYLRKSKASSLGQKMHYYGLCIVGMTYKLVVVVHEGLIKYCEMNCHHMFCYAFCGSNCAQGILNLHLKALAIQDTHIHSSYIRTNTLWCTYYDNVFYDTLRLKNILFHRLEV